MLKPAQMERISCVVPFCRATRGDRKNDPVRQDMEWICSKHWALVGRETKARKRTAVRLLRKAERLGRTTLLPKLKFRAWCAWRACRTEAIERALGIG